LNYNSKIDLSGLTKANLDKKKVKKHKRRLTQVNLLGNKKKTKKRLTKLSKNSQ